MHSIDTFVEHCEQRKAKARRSRKSRQPSNHAADGGADSYDPKILFWVLVPVAASIIIPTALGYLGDERVPDDKAGFKTELIRGVVSCPKDPPERRPAALAARRGPGGRSADK